MAQHERQGIRLSDRERNVFDAVWSRSEKHLIVTVARRGDWDDAAQVELTPRQLGELREFLEDAPPAARPD